MKYKIITEESMDIEENFAKENDIEILPIEVNFNGEIYPDGLPKPEFYEKLKGGVIPKTSAPNQYRFETALEPYANKEDWFVIVCVISAELSGTIAQAKNAVESLEMKNAYVCDSRVTTWALGAIVTELANWIKAHPEAEPQQVIDQLERLKESVRLVAVIGDLKYLKMGGRLSTAKFIAATVLGIKPVINLDGGKVNTAGTFRGEYANKFLVDCAKKRNKAYGLYFGNSNNRTIIKNFIEKYAAELEVDPQTANIADIGCVVGTHVGPNCYGVAYFV